MVDAWDVDLAGEVVVDGSDVYVTVVGEIDLASGAALQARLDHVVATTAGTVVVDLAGVGFIDSSGLRVLVELRRRLAAMNRSMRVHDPSAPTRRLLQLTGLGPELGVVDERCRRGAFSRAARSTPTCPAATAANPRHR